MRELIEKNQRITMVPFDFKNANKGLITEVTPEGFTLELDYEPDGILKSNYCEFYTTTKNGILYFDSYAKDIKNCKSCKTQIPTKKKIHTYKICSRS